MARSKYLLATFGAVVASATAVGNLSLALPAGAAPTDPTSSTGTSGPHVQTPNPTCGNHDSASLLRVCVRASSTGLTFTWSNERVGNYESYVISPPSGSPNYGGSEVMTMSTMSKTIPLPVGEYVGYASISTGCGKCSNDPQFVSYDLLVSAGLPPAFTAPIVGMAQAPGGLGYWAVGSDGNVYQFGNARNLGDMVGTTLAQPVAGMAATPDGNGYWLVAKDGGIFAFGDAHFFGSTGNVHLNQPVVGMAATADGGGYWMVAADGGIFSFGDAVFYGSTGGLSLNRPVVGMAVTKSDQGYFLDASDGGIFAFGDAYFQGSLGNLQLNEPVVGMATDPSTNGYWEVAADGGVFSFGAPFFGSTGAIRLNLPIVGMAATPTGSGYRSIASDGGIFDFGDAKFYGSLG